MRRARAGEAAALRVRQARHQLRRRGRSARASARRAFATAAASRAATAAPTCRSWSSRSATTPTARSATASTGRASRFAAGLRRSRGGRAEAARRTVAKLGARKIATGEVPVVFDPEAAAALLGLLVGVMSGGAIWRRSELSRRPRGHAGGVAAVRIVDDPLMPRAARARAPFDGEGLPSPHQRARLGRRAADVPLRHLRRAQARPPVDRLGGRGIGGGPHVGDLEPDPARRAAPRPPSWSA